MKHAQDYGVSGGWIYGYTEEKAGAPARGHPIDKASLPLNEGETWKYWDYMRMVGRICVGDIATNFFLRKIAASEEHA